MQCLILQKLLTVACWWSGWGIYRTAKNVFLFRRLIRTDNLPLYTGAATVQGLYRTVSGVKWNPNCPISFQNSDEGSENANME
jgi:hypothetical protein